MTLQKTDLQKFFKRLRKLTHEKISYYAVGEYGDNTQRPHYHIILFNSSSENVQSAWSIDSMSIGHCHIGSVSDASIGYTLKYCSKDKRIPMWDGDDRNKEFSIMSKGLGKNYLNERTIKWHKAKLEERCYLPLKDGKKACMPRYYKDKMYNHGEKFRISVYQEYLQELEEEIPERIKVEQDINAFRRAHKKSKQRQTF